MRALTILKQTLSPMRHTIHHSFRGDPFRSDPDYDPDYWTSASPDASWESVKLMEHQSMNSYIDEGDRRRFSHELTWVGTVSPHLDDSGTLVFTTSSSSPDDIHRPLSVFQAENSIV